LAAWLLLGGACGDGGDEAPGGASGLGGQGGVGGVGGVSGVSGSGGSGGSGGVGGGAGGAGCVEDGACASQGAGSLCVGEVCTKASASCDKAALLVVEKGFAGTLDDAPLGACYFRALDDALGAVDAEKTKRLDVYAAAATASAPIAVGAGVRLAGHGPAAGQAVALAVTGGGGVALVTLGDGASLAGFRLDAQGAKAVAVPAGAASLSGPLELRGGAPALAVEGTAQATVTGSATAKVLVTANARGVVVAAEAAVAMQGGDDPESLVVEDTNGGAAVLFEASTAAGQCSALGKVTLRRNKGVSGTDGTGALEVRRGRQVVVDGCTFEDNRQSVTFNGIGGAAGSGPDDFAGVQLQRNQFAAALPTEGGGSVVCGSNLGSDNTTLPLRDGNVFPSALACDPAATSSFNCGGGQVLAHSGGADLAVGCSAGTCQCSTGTLQCGGT
jgi:hypothetical protein